MKKVWIDMPDDLHRDLVQITKSHGRPLGEHLRTALMRYVAEEIQLNEICRLREQAEPL